MRGQVHFPLGTSFLHQAAIPRRAVDYRQPGGMCAAIVSESALVRHLIEDCSARCEGSLPCPVVAAEPNGPEISPCAVEPDHAAAIHCFDIAHATARPGLDAAPRPRMAEPDRLRPALPGDPLPGHDRPCPVASAAARRARLRLAPPQIAGGRCGEVRADRGACGDRGNTLSTEGKRAASWQVGRPCGRVVREPTSCWPGPRGRSRACAATPEG